MPSTALKAVHMNIQEAKRSPFKPWTTFWMKAEKCLMLADQ
jgi:hypothetical protein